MKSSLKRIHDARNRFDILNSPNYFIWTNPFYQVNKFITNIDKDLNKNFINNINNLIIEEEPRKIQPTVYNYYSNILNTKGLLNNIYTLLHMASNDIDKRYLGIIIEDGIGYSLNEGLTELFANEICYKGYNYPFEVTVAKSLFMIDKKIVAESYFNNDGNNLMLINSKIKDLMISLDSYHDNYVKLLSLYKEKNIIEQSKYKDEKLESLIENLNYSINMIEEENFENVYNIFNILINIINNSKIEEEQKQYLFKVISDEFNSIFTNSNLTYLQELSYEIKRNIYMKRR